MSSYVAPLKDILFSMYDVNSYEDHYKEYELTKDLISVILEQAGKFSEKELFPLNSSGDKEGARYIENEVKVPSGYKEAFLRYVGAGWPTLSQPEQYGGQGLPASVSTIVTELWQSSNQAWSMYPFLGEGACETLLTYGSQELKETFLPNLVSGKWTGTMCLTEANAGSDLGLLRTRADLVSDNVYSITGTKIFISSGDHDISENIIHLVLARLADAPKGSKGISLFIVPKFIVNNDGGLGERNAVYCGYIEEKMGLKGSATCEMIFDGATGYLVGPANKGLACMFTFINKSRLGTAVQGQAQAEGSYQMALKYAQERLQGNRLGSSRTTDPIVEHPDVRRMLKTQKVFSEGGRILTHYCAKLVDVSRSNSNAESISARRRLSLLIPVAKGCLTEWGFEAADLGIQVFGGHGYIHDSGIEQRLRDVRVSRLYEGTTGIQAQDYLFRKVVGDQGSTIADYTKEILDYCEREQGGAATLQLTMKMRAKTSEWHKINKKLIEVSGKDKLLLEEVAYDYLMYSGYIVLAYQWLQISRAASCNIDDFDCTDKDYYLEKIEAARFMFYQILPRSIFHLSCICNVLQNDGLLESF